MAASMNKNLVGCLVSGGVMLTAPFAISAVLVRRAFVKAASAAPADKAALLSRDLAEGLNNGAALGLLVSLLALVPTVVFGVRFARRAKAR